MISRFAPSPTGHLHLGHAFAAWIAWQAAREAGGSYLLRWEDIDGSRCRPEYEASTLEDLDWLGLPPDDVSMRQSKRLPHYEQALATLRERDLLYPCFCTRRDIQEEIAQSGRAPHGPDGPIYPGLCRHLSAADVQSRIDGGVAHAWRLKMDQAVAMVGKLSWQDVEAGEQLACPEIFGDVVLARKDIPTSYHLAVTVDDANQEITLVTRGGDLFESTHIHRLLQALLDLPVPMWHHHRVICDANGKRLAKRDAATTLGTLREDGITAEDIWRRLDIEGRNARVSST
ncbi:tRNA glutamyl-Q(34) synthetase GluQRS [bacterium]|nr:tRNA glutamyl-Q(34) synthetase GluQRS [bacterium]MDF1786623.1 tRNA glutamyl-Q(34) synthetase GluQRS [Verrucomicrobiales bacterium]